MFFSNVFFFYCGLSVLVAMYDGSTDNLEIESIEVLHGGHVAWQEQ